MDMQQEYSDWKDNLPENLQQSALGEKLDAIVELGLELQKDQVEEALGVVQEASGADLPLGFGRD
jgi:hypothetical protein